jgi:hypothetical protein
MSETDRSGNAGAELEQPTGVDVAVAVRERSRHEALLLATALPCFVAGIVLLDHDPGGWSRTVWAGSAAAAVVAAVLVWALLVSAPGRRRQEKRYLAEYAVLHHCDPGLGRYGEADLRARAMTAQQTFGLVVSFFALVQAARADSGEPVQAWAGLLLLTLGVVVLVGDALRQARAGRRWLADPPGPRRD